MEEIFIERIRQMKIAVTDTGKPEKQKIYLDWLASFDSNAELVTVSYKNGKTDISAFDGLVLTGGEDIDPILSKASPIELVEQFDRQRDDFEFGMLEQAFASKIPIFGICRGLQTTNVFLGGTLIADLPAAGFQDHTAKKNEPELRHEITVSEGTLIQSIVAVNNGVINSYHHQSALNVADELIASSYSTDGVIESLEWKNKNNKSFLMLVQWHPERMRDSENPFTTKIGEAFFAETKKFNSTK